MDATFSPAGVTNGTNGTDMKSFLLILCCLFAGQPGNAQIPPEIRVYGIKINVTDLDKALDFYVGKLGFVVASREAYPQLVWLDSRDPDHKICLNRVNNLAPTLPSENRAGFTLQVNHLDSTLAALKAKNVALEDPQKRREGVGFAFSIQDPFGTPISLMQQTVVETPRFQEPKLYNYGFRVPDMDKARAFYKILGFVERSERYLPLDMPMGHADKKFGFMLHYREGVEAIRNNSANDQHVVVLFRCNDLEKAIEYLKAQGVQLVQKQRRENELGGHISFYDPFGLVSELVEVK